VSQRGVSGRAQPRGMTDDGVETTIRQAIGGDPGSIAWILAHADTLDDPVLMTMAALLERSPHRLARATTVATSRRDRQVVAIARAHLARDSDLVDALARDHLVDHPGSFIVSWIASDSALRARPETPPKAQDAAEPG
jgi:hypothetical protein